MVQAPCAGDGLVDPSWHLGPGYTRAQPLFDSTDLGDVWRWVPVDIFGYRRLQGANLVPRSAGGGSRILRRLALIDSGPRLGKWCASQQFRRGYLSWPMVLSLLPV